MLRLLIQLFGERANESLIIHVDGKDWVSSKSLCRLLGVHSEYHLVEDRPRWPEMNLTQEDKRKFYHEGAHLSCPIWFVSESGFWKIVARSTSLGAAKCRASFLPM